MNETSPLFILETSDPKLVTITLSDIGRELIGDDAGSTFEDLMENIDQNFRSGGYIYDLQLNDDQDGILIKPFEDSEEFNQEVFNLISEEVDFMDKLVNNTDDEEADL